MCKIDKGLLKEMWSKKVLTQYALFMTTLFLALTFVNSMLIYGSYTTTLNSYKERLVKVEKTEGYDSNLFCNTVNCVYLENGYGTYEDVNGVIRHVNLSKDYFKPKYLGIFNKDFYSVIKYKDLNILIDDREYFNSLNALTLLNYILLLILFTIGFMIYKYKDLRLEELANRNMAEELESTLQRDFTESFNHEATLPIAVIRDGSDYLYKTINSLSACANSCSFGKKLTKDKDDFNTMYEEILLAIETLEELMVIIADSKEVKNNSMKTSIDRIINTVMSGIKVTKVTSIELTIKEGQDLVKDYKPASKLGNGKFISILKNFITNSVEAKASKISIVFKVEEGMGTLFLIDNGLGIKDNNGNLITDIDRIFTAGVTTKDRHGNATSDKSKLSKTRGVGLYLNKQILLSVGGDINLIKTSKLGTIFKLIFPVEKIKE